MTYRSLSAFIFLAACAETKADPAPVAGTGSCFTHECATTTEISGSSSSTTADAVGECDAYVGCVDACSESDCQSLCADATGVDETRCEQIRCDALIDACSLGDDAACTDLLGCAATPSETSLSVDSSSTDTGTGSSTDTGTGSSTDTGTGSSTDTVSSTSGGSTGSSESGTSGTGMDAGTGSSDSASESTT